jgi:hypothetical protein
MAANRRQPPKAERDALRTWIELARTAPGAPIPGHIAEELRGIAREIRQLALPWGSPIPAKSAAAIAAATAGLTGRAIADFRAEQRALWTRGLFEANRHLPKPAKSTVVAGEVMSSVGERQVYKRIRAHKQRNRSR